MFPGLQSALKGGREGCYMIDDFILHHFSSSVPRLLSRIVSSIPGLGENVD